MEMDKLSSHFRGAKTRLINQLEKQMKISALRMEGRSKNVAFSRFQNQTGRLRQSIAGRFFGHTRHTHELLTQRERALVKFGIRPGDRVSFTYEGRKYVGFVNRITKRATIMVENHQGELYSDGKRYAKYYVPIEMLTPLNRQ